MGTVETAVARAASRERIGAPIVLVPICAPIVLVPIRSAPGSEQHLSAPGDATRAPTDDFAAGARTPAMTRLGDGTGDGAVRAAA